MKMLLAKVTNFGHQETISVADQTQSVFAADLDGDRDLDVISASNDRIAWYDNLNGLGHFGPQIVITKEVEMAKLVVVADLDGDGHLDVISASSNDNKVAW